MRIHETANPFVNKKQILEDFIKYWREHSDQGGQNGNIPTAFQGTLDPLVTKNVWVENDGSISSFWKIILRDSECTKLPFKFYSVRQMHLSMPNLQTLENTPRIVEGIFGIEPDDSGIGALEKLNTMSGGPKTANHMTFVFKTPVANLQTSLTAGIDSIWIQAPEIKSFAGFNSHCAEMTLTLTNQQSISGIHKQLKGVDSLFLVLPENFSVGLLGLVMIPGIKQIGSSPIPPRGEKAPYHRAITTINELMKQKKNVHDIQEELIEAGLGQFARL